MTTLAYKAGVMACDSCWAYGDVQTTSATKLLGLPSGAVLGQAGDADSRPIQELLARVKSSKQLPTKADLAATHVDFCGLLAFPSGEVFMLSIEPASAEANVWLAQLWRADRRGMAAAGSGSHLALGAMAAGKTAREAVAIACDWDLNSRLPVHSLPVVKRKPRL